MRVHRRIGLIVGALREALHCFFGVGATCRFDPVCSKYAKTAIERHGWLIGVGLFGFRILRCHPFSKAGWDPVPERPFRWVTESRRA